MKYLKIIFILLLFLVCLFLFICYALEIPLEKILLSREITLKDLEPTYTRHTKLQDSAIRDINLIDTPEKVGDDKVHAKYYIIVGSFKSLIQSQKKAEKIRNDLKIDIIVLPVTKEGYFRISFGEYSTLEEAKSRIDSIRININSDAWIFSSIH